MKAVAGRPSPAARAAPGAGWLSPARRCGAAAAAGQGGEVPGEPPAARGGQRPRLLLLLGTSARGLAAGCWALPAWQLRHRVSSLGFSFSEHRAECTRFTLLSWHLSAALRGENEIRQQTYTIMLLPTHLVCRGRQGHRSCIDFFSSGKCGFSTLAYLMLLSC